MNRESHSISFIRPSILLFSFYLLSVIIQDLPLQIALGTITRSPYIFLSPLVFVYCFFISQTIRFDPFTKTYFLYFTYSVCISIIMILYWVYFKEESDIVVYNENLWVKLIKSCIYNLILMLTLNNFIFIFRHVEIYKLVVIFKVIVCVQLAIGYTQFYIPHLFDNLLTPDLHATERLSLLNTEPSQAFPQFIITIICYFVLKKLYSEKLSIFDYGLLCLSIPLLLLVQSKGGIIIMVFCFFFLLLGSKFSIKLKLKLLASTIILLIPVLWVIVNVILPDLLTDIEQFSSFSTRTITILSGFVSLFAYPFGQGYSAYYITYPLILQSCINYVLYVSPLPLLSFELDYMIDTGRTLGVKSGLLNDALYSGWAVVFFYFRIFKLAYKKLTYLHLEKGTDALFKFLLLFILINYLLVSGIETSYVAFLPFALIEATSKKLFLTHPVKG